MTDPQVIIYRKSILGSSPQSTNNKSHYGTAWWAKGIWSRADECHFNESRFLQCCMCMCLGFCTCAWTYFCAGVSGMTCCTKTPLLTSGKSRFWRLNSATRLRHKNTTLLMLMLMLRQIPRLILIWIRITFTSFQMLQKLVWLGDNSSKALQFNMCVWLRLTLWWQ